MLCSVRLRVFHSSSSLTSFLPRAPFLPPHTCAVALILCEKRSDDASRLKSAIRAAGGAGLPLVMDMAARASSPPPFMGGSGDSATFLQDSVGSGGSGSPPNSRRRPLRSHSSSQSSVGSVDSVLGVSPWEGGVLQRRVSNPFARRGRFSGATGKEIAANTPKTKTARRTIRMDADAGAGADGNTGTSEDMLAAGELRPTDMSTPGAPEHSSSSPFSITFSWKPPDIGANEMGMNAPLSMSRSASSGSSDSSGAAGAGGDNGSAGGGSKEVSYHIQWRQCRIVGPLISPGAIIDEEADDEDNGEEEGATNNNHGNTPASSADVVGRREAMRSDAATPIARKPRRHSDSFLELAETEWRKKLNPRSPKSQPKGDCGGGGGEEADGGKTARERDRADSLDSGVSSSDSGGGSDGTMTNGSETDDTSISDSSIDSGLSVNSVDLQWVDEDPSNVDVLEFGGEYDSHESKDSSTGGRSSRGSRSDIHGGGGGGSSGSRRTSKDKRRGGSKGGVADYGNVKHGRWHSFGAPVVGAGSGYGRGKGTKDLLVPCSAYQFRVRAYVHDGWGWGWGLFSLPSAPMKTLAGRPDQVSATKWM